MDGLQYKPLSSLLFSSYRGAIIFELTERQPTAAAVDTFARDCQEARKIQSDLECRCITATESYAKQYELYSDYSRII